MTINYADWVYGSDTSGNGSRTNPYKTIDKASTGLTGGDEVRCAKSPDNSDITAGNLNWTHNSDIVYTTGGWNPTGVIAANDLIRKKTLAVGDYPFWYRVLTVYSDRVVIRRPFLGVTETDILSQKHGIINVGIMLTPTTPAHIVMASGTSLSSRLKISGGWDLSVDPPTQPSVTWYIEGTTDPVLINGWGLYTNNKSFLNIEKFGMVKFAVSYRNTGPSAGITYDYCDAVTWVANVPFDFRGIQNQSICNCAIKNAIICNQQTIYLSGFGNEITNVLAQGGTSQIGQVPSNRLILDNYVLASTFGPDYVTCLCYTDSIMRNIIADKVTYGAMGADEHVYASTINGIIVFTPSGGWNIGQYGKENELFYVPQLLLTNIGGVEYERAYYPNGYTIRNTLNAKSGSCTEIVPTDATYPVTPSLKLPLYMSADDTVTVYFWAKKSSEFDGTLKAGLFFRGTQVDGWDTINLTTSYQQFSLSSSVIGINEQGMMELLLKTVGTTGSVYIDSDIDIIYTL